MIDLNLFELLSTAGVGTIAMFSLLYFYYLYLKLFDIRTNNRIAFISWVKNYLKNEYKQSGYTLISTILIFSFGVMVEDFTDHLADSEKSKNPIISQIKIFNILKTEGNLRIESLTKNSYELSGLGKTVFNSKHLFSDPNFINTDTFFFNTADPSEYWQKNGKRILDPKQTELYDTFIEYVNKKYYISKNWCYLYSEPARKELIDIQTRIDLARSITLISFFSIILVFVFYLLYYAHELLVRKKHKFKVIHISELSSGKKTIVEKKLFLPFRALAVLLLVFFATLLCYEVAENNFNERAFGYYISHFKYFEKDD